MISEDEARDSIVTLLQRTHDLAKTSLLPPSEITDGTVALTNKTWLADPDTGRRLYCAALIIVGESEEAVAQDGATAVASWRS